jgi:hypothetical protein
MGVIPDEVSQCFQCTSFFQQLYGLGVDSAINRNEYQEVLVGNKEWLVHKVSNLTTICVGSSMSHNS